MSCLENEKRKKIEARKDGMVTMRVVLVKITLGMNDNRKTYVICNELYYKETGL